MMNISMHEKENARAVMCTSHKTNSFKAVSPSVSSSSTLRESTMFTPGKTRKEMLMEYLKKKKDQKKQDVKVNLSPAASSNENEEKLKIKKTAKPSREMKQTRYPFDNIAPMHQTQGSRSTSKPVVLKSTNNNTLLSPHNTTVLPPTKIQTSHVEELIPTKKVEDKINVKGIVEKMNKLQLSRLNLNSEGNVVGFSDTECVSTHQQILARIDEANCMARVSPVGAKAIFAEMMSLEKYAVAKSMSLFWIAWSKFEEDMGNYDQAIQLLDAAKHHVKESEVNILKLCTEDSRSRIAKLKLREDMVKMLTPKVQEHSNKNPNADSLKTTVQEASRSAIKSLNSNNENKVAPIESNANVESSPIQGALRFDNVEETGKEDEGDPVESMCDMSFSAVYDDDDPLSKYLIPESNPNNRNSTPGLLKKNKIKSTPRRVPLVEIPDDEQTGRIIKSNPKAPGGSSVVMLAEVRTPSKKIRDFGSPTLAVPVRRSIRNSASKPKNNSVVLQKTNFSYAPNEALSGLDFPKEISETDYQNKTISISSESISKGLLNVVDKKKLESSGLKVKFNLDVERKYFSPQQDSSPVIRPSEEYTSSPSCIQKEDFGTFHDMISTKNGAVTPVRRSRRLTQTPNALRQHLEAANNETNL